MSNSVYMFIFFCVCAFVYLSLYMIGFRQQRSRKKLNDLLSSNDTAKKTSRRGVPDLVFRMELILEKYRITKIVPLISRLTGITDYSVTDFTLGFCISALCALSGLIVFRDIRLCTLLFIAGMTLPLVVHKWKVYKRDNALLEQLPHVVDMISRALRAGQSMDDALRETARHFDAPAGDEIQRVYEQMAMGVSFETAIRNFEKRYIRLADIKLLCTAFIIQRETGGNLAVTLDNIADTIRQRFTLYRQIKALSADGRLSALIIGLLPIAFGIFTSFFRPDYIRQLFFTPEGKSLLFTAIILEIIGIAIMFRITRIKI